MVYWGTAAHSSFKVSGQQHPTFTSSRTLPALTALGSLWLPLAHRRVVTCSAKLLYHLDGTVSNRSRLHHAGQTLGTPPNPLPLRQPGRPGRGPIRHVSLQKSHTLLRSLFYLTAMFLCVVDVEYIPGVSNVVADAISRGYLQVLYQLHPSADRERTQPAAIPTLPGKVAYLQPCSTTACMR